jgi:hypothetical protein
MSQVSEANSSNQTNDNNSQDLDMPKDLQSAIEKIKQLSLKRDELLHQKAKSSKELGRMIKSARLAQIKTLVPRELFHREDHHAAEVPFDPDTGKPHDCPIRKSLMEI